MNEEKLLNQLDELILGNSSYDLKNELNIFTDLIAGITFQDKQKHRRYRKRFHTAIDEYESISDIFARRMLRKFGFSQTKLRRRI